MVVIGRLITATAVTLFVLSAIARLIIGPGQHRPASTEPSSPQPNGI